MSTERCDDTSRDAKFFLNYVTDEICTQAAMLADAADEGMHFTRQVDSEITDPAELAYRVQMYLSKMEHLFVQRACLTTSGYTAHMLQFLKAGPYILMPAAKTVRSVGGPNSPSESVINSCLQKMRKFLKCAVAVAQAEYPDFQLIATFRIFKISETATTPPDVENREWATQFERLAKFNNHSPGQLSLPVCNRRL